MSVKLLFIVSFYFLSAISTLGFGFFLKYYLTSNKINLDYGISGLLGIFFLILYSYLSHFFIAHGIIHNSILFLLGIFSFLFFFPLNYNKIYFKIICLIFVLLIIAFFCFKTHDDFPYYHFPYTNYLTKSEIIIGVGNYDPAFRSPSSIFYFNSLFYLPFIKHNLYHIGSILIMGYSLTTICTTIFERFKLKKIDHIFFYSLISFTFILVFFYRISEHGTDRSAQILSFILILEILIFFKKEQIFDSFLNKIFIIGSLIISLKVFYLIYMILLIPIIYFVHKKKYFLKEIIKNKLLYLSILFLFLMTSINFFNSGCLAYPLPFSCFENFNWSVSLEEVQRMKTHYENWSKAGASPNFSVDNYSEYISNFNWFSGWLDRYFFNKVSDFLLGLLFLTIIFIFTFYSSKKKNNEKLNLKLLYTFLAILFLEWFYNHPTLRYGGYSLIAILIFIPLSVLLAKFYNDIKKLRSKVFFILFLTVSIFFYRHVDRISFEHEFYNYSPFKTVFYKIDEDHHFRVEKEFKKTIEFYENCTRKKIKCENKNKLLAFKKFNRFVFVESDKFSLEEVNGTYTYSKKRK